MSLRNAYTAVRIIETSENYARADQPLREPLDSTARNDETHIYSDEQFWYEILNDPDRVWGAKIHFDGFIVSNWIPRVPGLYWTRDSATLRKLNPGTVEYIAGRWHAFQPQTKSQKVLGGIGTLRLPQAINGTCLVSLSGGGNASAGIPALLSADVIDRIQKSPSTLEGIILTGIGQWLPMDTTWSARFPITRNVPRGYLVLDNPDILDTRDELAPTLIHPFTVMEYTAGSSELFDYVFASADTTHKEYRQRLEEFFDDYKSAQERYGSYLLAGDMVTPLWDAKYNGPEDLRRAEPSAESQLEILTARVRDKMLGKETVEKTLDLLGIISASAQDLRRISEEILIPPALWLAGGTLAELCNQFLDTVLERDKLEELIETLAHQYPELITIG